MRKHVFATLFCLAAALMLTGCPKPDPSLRLTVQTFNAMGELENEPDVTDTSVPIETSFGAIITACDVKVLDFSTSSAKTEEPEDWWHFFVGAIPPLTLWALDEWADWDLLSGTGNGEDTGDCSAFGLLVSAGERKAVMLTTATGPVILTFVSTAEPEAVGTVHHDVVPNYNDPTSFILRGHVEMNVSPAAFAVTSYLYIPAIGGWSGPFPGEGFQPDLVTGAFAYNISGHPVDRFATKVRTYLVPDSVDSPVCNVCSEPPLISDALAWTETDRTSQVNPDIVLDYVPVCDDPSNTVLMGHVFDVAPGPHAVVAYLYIPNDTDGWTGPFPGTGADIGEDGKFFMNIVGHPSDFGATKIRVYAVPDAWESPTCNVCSEAPVLPYAVAWTEVVRDCDDGGSGEGEGEGSAEGEGEGEVVNYFLNVVIDGQGSVTTNPTNTGAGYPEGTVVTLTATPQSENTFTGWSDNVVNPFINPTTVVMNGNKAVTASFESIVGEGEGEGEGEVCTDPNVTPTLLSIIASSEAGAVTAVLDGVTACSMSNAKLELFAVINFANAPYEYYGVVTKPTSDSPYNQYWPITSEGISLYYNQDPRDVTAQEIIVRLVTEDAESQFLDTNTSVADGDPLNLPPLTKGSVLGTARLDLQTKVMTVVNSL